MSLLYALAKYPLMALPPETAHNFTVTALKSGLIPAQKINTNPILENNVFGLHFSNPVGLAAGFDKNADTMAAMFNLGMGFVEIGTVTPQPQKGNPKQRVFRAAKNNAVINRMGFPNGGLDKFKDHVTHFLMTRKADQTLGINIGKNKDTEDPYEDYINLIQSLGSLADYITVNISSPNTPGLRELQKSEFLAQMIRRVKAARSDYCTLKKPPILVKLSPDMTDEEMQMAAQACIAEKVDGLILTNTTLDRPEDLPLKFRQQQGGLSGKPLTDRSTAVIAKFYALTKGTIPIIGIGGILSAEDAYTKIKAGASLIQLYTGLIYRGPTLIKEIRDKLPSFLEKDGFSRISDAIGCDVK
ncbi:MAG: dihydroorotate dehydrogenase (quinone) [Micavibrio sp.]|nr:dihydroorotate dehydrogenase (quinone) [Micavibrio sp.]